MSSTRCLLAVAVLGALLLAGPAAAQTWAAPTMQMHFQYQLSVVFNPSTDYIAGVQVWGALDRVMRRSPRCSQLRSHLPVPLARAALAQAACRNG